MKELGIDIETYSSNDLPSCGVYKYTEADDFTVLLFAYAVDNGSVQIVDLACGEQLPDEIRDALTDESVTKTAYNAAFERICLSRFLGLPYMDPAQWQCTMVAAARLGLPLCLAQCGEVLRLSEGKMREGAALIRYFSLPGKNGRHMPSDAPEKWEVFKRYCVRDVEVEQAILKKVRRLQPTATDEMLRVVDQTINDRGVMIDADLVAHAAQFDERYKAQLAEEAVELTGLSNPNSPAQLKEWLSKVTGESVASLNKKNLDDLADKLIYWPKAQRVLQIRREMGKTSNKKYSAMQQCVCKDGRIHGLLQFYGAARTGRWAGRLVQVQNLPQNHLDDLDYARNIVKAGDYDEFVMNYGNPTQVLSELIRTAFIAKPGCTFHVCDFSAIEARVIAWLAGESWVLEVFRSGGDIYCETASKMFGVPVEKHGRNAELRQKGKIATLALGYGGGVSALEAMGGKRLGLTEQEEKEIVKLWRRSNPYIVKLWKAVEEAAINAIRTNTAQYIHRGILVKHQWGMLLITLPSGRVICYPRATVGTEYDDGYRGDHDIIEYEGTNQTTKKWEKVRTYGGKLTENIVQSIARDILGVIILRAYERGYDIVFHIHDEIVVEAHEGQTLQAIEAMFSEPIHWCPGLPLKGAGYTTPYYLKD